MELLEFDIHSHSLSLRGGLRIIVLLFFQTSKNSYAVSS